MKFSQGSSHFPVGLVDLAQAPANLRRRLPQERLDGSAAMVGSVALTGPRGLAGLTQGVALGWRMAGPLGLQS
jgi:hypothetical protein